jgi:transcriptional regulator with XRE-family HTH domain
MELTATIQQEDTSSTVTFGTKLRTLRKRQGWSQDEFGLKVGIHGRHVGKYENDKVLPNADTIIRIARLFQVSIDYLLRDEVSTVTESHAALHDQRLLRQFEAVEKMNADDQHVIGSLIDAYIKKQRIQGVLTEE